MTIEIDWNSEWSELNQNRSNPGDADSWNQRSLEYAKHSSRSNYAKKFMDYLNPHSKQTFLDMGCGTGALCIPLAKLGHKIIAADFSEGMLNAASKKAQAEGVSNSISFIKRAWEDDWFNSGLDPKSVDVAIASRSTMVPDLDDAFFKLNSIAQDKVCITMATDLGPRNFKDIAISIGRLPEKQPDFIYGINLLIQQGYDPELSYIDSYKDERFGSRDDAISYFDEYFDNLNQAELLLLNDYLDQHLIKQDQDSKYHYQLDVGRLIRWAFISWKPKQDIKPRW
jgi:SAM-dependent methyltransferase